MKRNREEENIQRAVAEYLDLVLPDDVVWFHVPNGGARTKAEAGILKAMGVKAGVPDIYILSRGDSIFIELKPKGRSLSKPQKDMAARLASAGAVVATCHSLDEVDRLCRACIPGLRVAA